MFHAIAIVLEVLRNTTHNACCIDNDLSHCIGLGFYHVLHIHTPHTHMLLYTFTHTHIHTHTFNTCTFRAKCIYQKRFVCGLWSRLLSFLLPVPNSWARIYALKSFKHWDFYYSISVLIGKHLFHGDFQLD